MWFDRRTPDVMRAQRLADYSYRLAVDPPAAKEVRLFGLADWVIDRFAAQRRRLYDLQYEATRLRERSVAGALAIVLVANGVVCWTLGDRAVDGQLDLAAVIVALQAAIGVSAIAFGGLNWALDGAAAPVAALRDLEAVTGPHGALDTTGRAIVPPGHGPDVRFRDVTFGYPGGPPVLAGLDLTIPGGSSLAIVGQNGAGKTTLAKLLCRLYDPQSGSIEIDGIDLRSLDLDDWRRHVTAVFQDYVRFELPLRDNVAPAGGVPDTDVLAALDGAGAPSAWRRWTRPSPRATGVARICPAGSGSASPSPGRWRPCGRGPASCCWTSRPPSSTFAARPRSSSASSPRPAAARRSSCRTASRRCATPTASACSSTAPWSSSARTPS